MSFKKTLGPTLITWQCRDRIHSQSESGIFVSSAEWSGFIWRTIEVNSILISLISACLGRPCDPSDFHYEYTSCSESGQRWRVAVPRGERLDCEGEIPPPQKGLNCTFSCRPGSYLDLETQTCRICAAGRYSLGGGIRFDEFTHLPSGFSIENFDNQDDQILLTATSQSAIKCPEEAGWLVRDSELLYTPSPCVSKLSFTTNLVRPGYVEYSYRMPKNSRGIALNVVVKNEQCQSYRDELKSLLLGTGSSTGKGGHHEDAGNGDWQKKRLELRTGPNVISWTVVNSREVGAQVEPIHVARIDIVGIAFTRECTLCPPGTYSNPGASECESCQAGFYSTKGSDECGKCPQSQYSGPKSSRCFDRPACRQSDFYPIQEPCQNGKTKVTYKMVLPAVCREDLPGAAKMPPPEPEKPCPKCNPGMALDTKGVCAFCGDGEMSDGNECKKCPTSTIPNYGYHYVQWTSMPPNIVTKCEYISEDVLAPCDIGDAWMADGTSLVSSPSLQRGIAFEAMINIDEGFSNPLLPRNLVPSQSNPVAHLTIVFESNCADDSCVLYFIEDVNPSSPSSFYRFLGAFNGSQQRRVWTHAISRRSPARFMVAFIRSRSVTNDDAITDQARILSINVTNVGHRLGKQGGGASECSPCPDSGKTGCIPCPKGHYMTEKGRICTKCPEGTFLNVTTSRIGVESCVKCGPNLESDGNECKSSGRFEVEIEANKTLSYDMSSLKNKSLVVSGVKVFAREGTSYFHSFNISLLGDAVLCKEEFDNAETAFGMMTDQPRELVESSACRLTAIPVTTKNHTKSIAYVSPLLLGIGLSAITKSKEWDGWKLTDELLDAAFVDNSSRSLDLHFFYSSLGLASDICPRGSAIAVTARCDPQQKKAVLQLPRGCPDGTCDGCLYHILLLSALSCPLCTPSDYTTIKGECVDGWQTVHSIPDKQCVLSGAASVETRQHCSILTAHLKLLIAIGTITMLLLIMILFVICQRNRKLEYKYMKLIESKGGGFELPAAETCGLESDEEDDEHQDRVVFSKGKSKFFGGRPKATEKAAFVPLENDED